MRTLVDFLRRIKLSINNDKVVLGRWVIDRCENKINNKIDWSNEDHCGPCGHSSLKPIKKDSNKPN